MLRFCGKGITKSDGTQTVIAEECVAFNQSLWKKGREYFRCGICDDVDIIRLLPVVNEKQELVCYAYQDDEANRELRMLKELGKAKEAMQFEDVFPGIRNVVIYGCNEMSYFFVKYLEDRKIAVSVIGRYWDYMGYTETKNDVCEEGTLIVCAEDIFQCMDLDQMTCRSVSAEFECIDKIYEANVKAGIIKDTEDEDIWSRLRGKEILILRTFLKAQDTYDLLCEHGIDIAGFVEDCGVVSEGKTLLGKRVVGLGQAVRLWKDAIFIDCIDNNSALGNKYVELLDYYGYERNKQFFFISDYADVPFSNLIHVLYGKKVLLTGDVCLCNMLVEYLYSVEKGNVEVTYIRLGQEVSEEEDGIRCLVVPCIRMQYKGLANSEAGLRDTLTDMKFNNYTEYFIRHRAIALIDRYLNADKEKYTVSELTPKGILLGRIPPRSGNVFFKGILDGHPDILLISDGSDGSDFNNDLFYYCIRLAGCDADEILPAFWKMYDADCIGKERAFARKNESFINIERFEKSFKRLTCGKKSFTSQELFIMFHIAYTEMWGGKQYSDVSRLVIYWEPHYISRDEFPFLALWLEDKKVNGRTVILRRDNMALAGSLCEMMVKISDSRYTVQGIYSAMFREEMDNVSIGQRCSYQYWMEHKLRFEDIKVSPRDKLIEICEWFGISWSDSMLKTTRNGEGWEWFGAADFDLRPVFKKSEAFFSEFDRFRISVACAPYQKKYGYTYENCMKFSRKELWELFLKPFFFVEQKIFALSSRDYRKICEQMKWNLWKVRKHMVLDDICPEFERFGLKSVSGK